MKTITCTSFNHVQLLLWKSQHCAHQRWIHTLTNVVIVNPTWIDLFPQFHATQKFITYDATQAKEKGYHV
jgi:hypothetical protein